MRPALQSLGPLPCLCDAFSLNGETLLLPDATSGLYLGVTNFAVVSQSNTALRFDNYNWLKLRTFLSGSASKEIPVYETTRKQRTDINELRLEGKSIIKAWEVFSPRAYNDAKGYCTIGYGELIAKDRCERITLPPEYRNGITPQQADQLFEKRIPRI
ncbi:glycoside hydrolase family protein [Pseudomonas mangiferae]|uniref:Lysozyme n=1 Tax=Pseudomonas mangiferae TaxID=2593654 RepID=A0A553GVF6_9PSED|nr:lysozyme [Pseudomonas mangiferae]